MGVGCVLICSRHRDMERPAEGLLLIHDHYTLYHHLPPVASLRRSACSDGPGPLARSSPPHATPNALNQSLAYTFRISVTVVPYICTDSGFLLDLQAEAALVRQHRRPHCAEIHTLLLHRLPAAMTRHLSLYVARVRATLVKISGKICVHPAS